ncbi:twin-arginine translocase subunit TatC [Permianibacter aggregans]|uniref:Sec-independent protein translocase protein TatC n=1 Tax=Permianibacter aggregans TaxID=1510150 RepID=A0A4R6UTN1_9GAMM|nr:twin-arginine translocase subunit TatC [Permianibacter aggregans]QGX40112.1 twin-arginine translocase subunit TatC [Permianibacter aggregans]TDQ49073.1 Sec-independent protein translocase TatC [Permianibacter aggregans]
MNARHSENSTAQGSREMPLMAHLVELRNRLMKVAVVLIICFLPFVYFAKELYQFFALPMRKFLPQGSMMIATEVGSTFFAPFKLAIVAALFVAMPYLLYQIWAFVSPGLYRHEKRLAKPLLFSAILLFYIGMAFAYFFVFPVIFGFFAGIELEGVAYMPDIRMYFDFAIFLLFAFGISFEIPVAVLILVKLGAVSVESLRNSRPYIIVGIFVTAAVLTPPDPISQSMMAVPMVLLFEGGVLLARLLTKSNNQTETVSE